MSRIKKRKRRQRTKTPNKYGGRADNRARSREIREK